MGKLLFYNEFWGWSSDSKRTRKFLKEGSLYRGYNCIMVYSWKTALADALVEYQDHKSDTIYVAFSVSSSNIKEINVCSYMDHHTWTIPANKALAYNESLDYLLIEINDEGDLIKKIAIAEALLESVIKDCGIKNFKKLKF